MIRHPTSEILSNKIGKNTRIWQYCVILEGAVIGDNCNINFNVFIEDQVVIGDNVTIKSGVQLWNGVTIEDNVFLGPNVTFTNDLTPRSQLYPERVLKTLVKKGSSIGANSTLLSGITIGECALIGAGSVVTKDVPAFTVWYGNPAKHSGYVTKDGILLNKQLISKDGKQFIFKNNIIVAK